jgi:hypothetical protein
MEPKAFTVDSWRFKWDTDLAMLLRDLMCEGRPAFPPKWKDPHTGGEPLRNETLAGILVEVEWGRHNLSLELTNFWRGRRLSGRLLTDDATILPRVHAMLSASLPRHIDELVDLEIPAASPTGAGSRAPASVGVPTAPKPPPPTEEVVALHPDVALLVATLVRKGLLDPDDVEDTRREIAAAAAPAAAPAPAAVSSPWATSPLAIRLREALALGPNEALDPAAVRLTPRK